MNQFSLHFFKLQICFVVSEFVLRFLGSEENWHRLDRYLNCLCIY
jgi:hypothetical protein